MIKIAQLGIALGALGVMIFSIGLFPGMIAIPPTPGFGVAQILIVIIGFATLIFGAIIYVKFSFYALKEQTLMQQIGVRLAYTGITFAVLTALADVLGFGSNLRMEGEDVLLGPWQLIGMMVSFGIAALGVIIFAVAGEPEILDE